MKHLFPGATGHFSLIQGCYWMTYCILISFSSLYLLDRGFTNTQIGLLLGIAGPPRSSSPSSGPRGTT